MEQAVLLKHSGPVPDAHGILAIGSIAAEFLHVLCIGSIINRVDGKLFECHTHLRYIVGFLFSDDGDNCMTPWLDGNQAVLTESTDSFTDRCPGDPELFCKGFFRYLHSTLELAGENLLLEHGIDLIGKTVLNAFWHSVHLNYYQLL
ncbi:hypothetical protein SDC9_120465 [bioreactor metagenome]|uniref:Uncharacterized protein n=1 Tax=bioreactor metagenome TaxID=1076179 RepID=A0A645C7C5_9ZZZZ